VKRTPLGADLIIPALAAAFAIYFLFSVSGLTWEARANGVLIGSILLLLVVLQLVRMGLRLYRGQADFGLGSVLLPRDALAKRLGMVAITVAFIATLPWLGLTLGLFLSMLTALWTMGVRRRLALVVLPLAVAGAAYLLFVALLQSDMPRGPIERLLG
jgi:hypothetical protein